MLALDRIRTDGGTQPRTSIMTEWFEEFAQEMARGAHFPPIVVFFDGTHYWLADGFHRFHAAASLGLAEIEAEVRYGGRADAVLHAAGANAIHGHRRTNEDKRRAVRMVWEVKAEWSDNEVARQCGVSQPFVSKLRSEITNNGYKSSDYAPRQYQDRWGNETTMRTANIGRRPVEPAAPEQDPRELTPLEQAIKDKVEQAVSTVRESHTTLDMRDLSKDWIGATIRQCCELVERLPPPELAAADIQMHQSVVLSPERLRRVSRWLTAFLELREATEVERLELYHRLYPNGEEAA